MITPESIQEVQRQIDIIDIIGGFVKLKKRGANYLGNCPFHHEKTPSFTVSPSKEIYKCFGCGKSGNAIGFVMEHEKYSFVEAIRWLAARYQIELVETGVTPEMKAQQLTADSLYILNGFARDFFEKALHETEEGQDIALSYLRERGFRPDIIRKFQLGYNPSARDGFSRTALEAQYNPEWLLKSGLSVKRDEQFSDNYRGRIIFPIHNQSGKVMGFGARIIRSNDRAPKYINTPENEIYVKSRILYGSYFARTAIDKADECLLVEGYTDVISLHQAGIENVVASGGTSLTQDQLRLIRKYTRNLTIIYDGDSAGVKAAMRGMDMALEEGLQVRLVLIPDREDPDSYVRRIGAEAFVQFIQKEKKDVILFQLETALGEIGQDSAQKAALVNQVADTLSRMTRAEEFTRRQDYIRKTSELLRIDEQGLHALVNQLMASRIGKAESRAPAEPLPPLPDAAADTPGIDDLLLRDRKHERALLKALIQFGAKDWDEQRNVARYLLEEIQSQALEELIDDSAVLHVLRLYREAHTSGEIPEPRYFLYHEDPVVQQLMTQLSEVEQELSPNWKEHYKGHIPTRDDLYREEILSSMQYLQLRKIRKLISENQTEMEKCENPEQYLVYLKAHMELKTMEQNITRQSGTVIFK